MSKIIVTTPEELRQIIHDCLSEKQTEINKDQLSTEKEDQLLTIEQVVDLLQISKPTLYRLRKKEYFPKGKRVGKKRYFFKSEILNLIKIK